MKAGGEDRIVAFETTPFREMVCYVKGCRGGCRVFVVDKGNGFDFGKSGVGCSMRLDDYVAGQEVTVAKDELGDCLKKETLRNVKREGRTPSLPNPGVSPSSATVRLSSCCSTAFRFCWAMLPIGRARIHFCITVQIFGVALLGVMAFISASNGIALAGEKAMVISSWSYDLSSVGSAAMMGKIACHSASLRATPFQTASRVRSADEQT